MAKDLKLLMSADNIHYGTFNDIVIENHDMLLIGTGDYVEYLSDQIDGIKRIFITSKNYISSSLRVFLDGNELQKDIIFEEKTSNTFQFVIGFVPAAGQILKVSYTIDNIIEKITQDIVKIFLTLRGTNLLAPNYGTNIPTLINTRKLTSLSKDIRDQKVYALTYVKQINQDELVNIDKVLDTDIEDGPNYFKINLKIQLTDGRLITITQDIARRRS